MMRILKFAIVASLAAAPAIATAQTANVFAPGSDMWMHNGVYFGAGFAYQNWGMPKFTGANQRRTVAGGPTNGEPVASYDQRLSVYGPEARIGYAFADGTMPAWLGRNFRVDLSGTWLTGRQTSTTSIFTDHIVTNLQGLLVAGFNIANPATTQLRTEVDRYRFGIRAAADFDVAPNLILSPSISGFGGRTKVNYDLAEAHFATGVLSSVNLIADTNWTDIGGGVGAKLAYRMYPSVNFHIGGHVNLAHRRATMTATHTYSAPAAAFFNASSISESGTRLAIIPGGEIGVTYSEGNWLVVSLVGGAEYDNKVPGFRGPSVPAGLVAGQSGSPARLTFSGQVNAFAMARVTVRIW